MLAGSAAAWGVTAAGWRPSLDNHHIEHHLTGTSLPGCLGQFGGRQTHASGQKTSAKDGMTAGTTVLPTPFDVSKTHVSPKF